MSLIVSSLRIYILPSKYLEIFFLIFYLCFILLDNGDLTGRVAINSDEYIQQFLWYCQGIREARWMDADIHYRHGIIESWLFHHDPVGPFTVAQTRVVYCLFVLELHCLLADLQLHSDHILLLQH